MTTVTVTTTGAGSFTIPAGVSEITFEAWGAGGNGGSDANQQPGGGGGAYIKKTLSVTAGQIVYYEVGPGAGSSSASWFNLGTNNSLASNGAYRAQTTLTSTGGTAVSASGGSGNQGAAELAFSGGDGAAAQGGGGTRAGSGGGGGAGPDGAGVAGSVGSGATQGAGGAGDNGSGGAGGTTGAGTANAEGGGGGAGGLSAGDGFGGGAPGGGGGGKGRTGTSGGAGARGQIRYTYTVTGATLTAESATFTLTGTAATLRRAYVMSASPSLTQASSQELLVNGSLTTDTDWVKGTGITISGGVGVFTSVASGQWLRQVVAAITAGKKYRITFEIVSYTAGGFQLRIGSALGSTYTALGTHSEDIVSDTTNTSVGPRAAGTTTGTVDNISLREMVSFLVSGTDAAFSVGILFPGESGSYALTGTAATFSLTRNIVATPGSYALTGADTFLKYGCVIAAEAASFALTGTDVSLEQGYEVNADPGSYALTGTDATLTYTPLPGETMTADPGSYTLTGTAASLEQGYVLAADPASFSLSGTDASLEQGYEINADAASFALTGSVASLYHGWKLVADGGSYVLTGTAANFLAGEVMTADPGAYVLSGASAGLLRGYSVSAAPGSYALSGTATSLLQGFLLPSSGGAYTLSGTAATLSKGSAMLGATPASFVLAGLPVLFSVATMADIIPARRQLIVFRHQEAEIVRVPKLNAVAMQAAVHREDVVSMDDLSHIAPLMGLEVHVWDAPGGYTPVFGDGFSWRRISDGSVLWPTSGGVDFLVVDSRAEMATAVGWAAMLLESGRQGIFHWDGTDLSAKVAADTAQGIYVAPSTDITGASGAWVRQFEAPVNPVWFGMVEGDNGGANGATNFAAWTAMMAALAVRGVVYNVNHRGLDPVRFPPGVYEFSDTLDIKAGQMDIAGWQGGGYRHTVTDLVFPTGVTGIRIQSSNTTGASGPAGASDFGGFGTSVRKLSLHGGYAGTEAEAHGIHLRGRAVIEDVFIEAFEGDGIYANASLGDGTHEGNVNNTRIVGCRIEDCRNGIYFNGTDANICHIEGVDSTSCRQWGFWESGFLGNNYISCHSSGCGTVPGSHPQSVVTHGGNRYTVVAGQEAGASTNAPSGTTADNTWWYYLGAGGADAGQGIAAWVNGTTYRAGGSYLSDGTGAFNHFFGCYQEGTTGIAQFADLTMVNLGKMGAYRGGAVLTAASSGYINTSLFRVTSVLRAEGTTTLFGTTSGGNLLLQLDTGSSTNTMTLRSTSGTTQTDAQFISTRNSGLTIRGFGAAGAQGNVNLASGSTVVARAQSTGFNVLSGFAYHVNNVQVVGAQGAAVADAAALTSVDGTDAVAAPTQAEFNALVAEFNKLRDDVEATRGQLNTSLARLRTHGLIAT